MSRPGRIAALLLGLGGLALLGLAWHGHVEAATLLLLQAFPFCG